MRKFEKNSDGGESLSPIDRSSYDMQRYMDFRSGLSLIEIAMKWDITPKAAEKSVKAGRTLADAEDQVRLRDLKYSGALKNEQIRQEVRTRIADKLVDAIEHLLEGKRSIISINKTTGEVVVKEVVDPEIMQMGVKAALTTLSLEEKPAHNTLVQVNNNAAADTPREGGLSYEERLTRIQRSQGLLASTSVTVNPRPADEEVTHVDVEIVDEPKSDEEPLF